MRKTILTAFLVTALGTGAIAQQGNFTQTANGVKFDMVFVDGGTFDMGCPAEENDGWFFESATPVHKVTLDGFYIAKFEVTRKLWHSIMGTTDTMPNSDNLPIWEKKCYEVDQFIEKLNKATGKKFRLPTEAEWEFAARGGNKSKGYKYSGGNDTRDVAVWVMDDESLDLFGVPEPVGSLKPNELGIYDMSGNVKELVADWFSPYSSQGQTNPKGPSSGTDRICRGGCVSDPSDIVGDANLYVWNRESYSQEDLDGDYSLGLQFMGFRLAMDATRTQTPRSSSTGGNGGDNGSDESGSNVGNGSNMVPPPNFGNFNKVEWKF